MEISVWANFMFKFFFSDYAFIDCKLSVNFKFIMCENKLCLPHERLCVNPVNVFSHPPKRRRVTYASTIRPASASASASTLSTSSMKPLHGIISYRTCILV